MRTPAAARLRSGGVGHPADRDHSEGSVDPVVRIPVGVAQPDAGARRARSARWIPASARTWIPDADSAALTVAATSGSSLIRIRGAASNRVTRDPKALKIEASCTPVAPAPTTSIDGGTEESRQASLCVLVSSNPGSGSRRDIPPVQMMNRSDCSTGPLAARDGVRVDEPGGAGMLVHRDARRPQLLAEQRVRAHLAGDLPDALQQPWVVQPGFPRGDAVARELSGLADEARGVGEGADRHGPVVGRDPAERVARDRARSARRVARPERAATTPAGPAPTTRTSRCSTSDDVMPADDRGRTADGIPSFG